MEFVYQLKRAQTRLGRRKQVADAGRGMRNAPEEGMFGGLRLPLLSSFAIGDVRILA